MKLRLCALLLAPLVLTAANAAKPIYRTSPAHGVQRYRYEVIQTINGSTRKGYRTEFDLDLREARCSPSCVLLRSSTTVCGSPWPQTLPAERQ